MSRIGRRVYVTHCTGIGFDADNKLINIETDLLGNIDSVERANVRVRKKLCNNRITIQSIDHSSKYYSMPLDVFIDNCDKVTD